ncbi:MAG TPA: GNAT family N-acetyltransferase [Thermoleophilaceae bacterium]
MRVVAPERREADTPAVERIAPDAWQGIPDWDETVAAAAAPSIFLTRDWASAWWASFGAGLEPCLLRVEHHDGRTAGLGLFYLDRLRGSPLTRLGMIGDRVVGSEYLGLVARRGSEERVAGAVAAWLSAAARWDVADLGGLRPGDPAADALERSLSARARRSHADEHPCATVALPGDFEEYLGGLNSKFRQRYRQRTNKLLRSCEVRFFLSERESDLPAHLDTLFRLHQARWVEAGRPGVFADARMRAFYRDVATRLLRNGRLRFWQLEADGAIRACQFGFAYDGVLHSLQEAYDSDFAPPGVGGLGVVLRGHAIRAAIEEGLRAYDFLGGVEDHKLRWGASVHQVRHVRIGSRGTRGALGWLASSGPEAAREWVKGALPDRVLEKLKAARADLHRRRGRREWR